MYLVAPGLDDQNYYQVLKAFNETYSENVGENVVEFVTYIDEVTSVEDVYGPINNFVVYDDVMLDIQNNPARIFPEAN